MRCIKHLFSEFLIEYFDAIIIEYDVYLFIDLIIY